MSLVVSACGAAADLGTSAPSSVPLLDAPTSLAIDERADDVEVADRSETSETTAIDPDPAPANDDATTTTSVSDPAPSTTPTTVTTTTVQLPDPNAAFCQAATAIDELGTFTALDDAEAAAVFFDSQAERWGNAAATAPAPIAADVSTVATFNSDVRTLLAGADYDLFAVFQEVTELEASSGSDTARIRTDQFIFANCEITPPLAEQATAAFYGELLASADDRTVLAELLASAEVFTLDGALCFVDQATADVMHPLVGAPATAAQEAALTTALSACQISIGTSP